MANEFDKQYDALVDELKLSIKNLLNKENPNPEITQNFNGITAFCDYWDIWHVVKEGLCEAEDVMANTYYFIDDMIMASEDIPLSMEDMAKYDDEDAAREEKEPTRIFREFCENDIELTSYEQLSLAYDNIKGAIEYYIND